MSTLIFEWPKSFSFKTVNKFITLTDCPLIGWIKLLMVSKSIIIILVSRSIRWFAILGYARHVTTKCIWRRKTASNIILKFIVNYVLKIFLKKYSRSKYFFGDSNNTVFQSHFNFWTLLNIAAKLYSMFSVLPIKSHPNTKTPDPVVIYFTVC